MPATPRDLLKPDIRRAWEVTQLQALRAGQANGQWIDPNGMRLAPHSTPAQLAISAGTLYAAGQRIQWAAVGAIVVPAGATTGAGQFCNVLVEVDYLNPNAQTTADVFLTAGALAGSAAAAVTPALTGTRIAVGYLAIPASFTAATTSLTAGMCINYAYSAGADTNQGA